MPDNDQNPSEDNDYLDSFRLRLDAGLVIVAKCFLDRAENRLSGSSNARVRERFSELKERLSELEQIERTHGRGAALNLDNGVTKELMRAKRPDGTPLLPENLVKSARRYQGIKLCCSSTSNATSADGADLKKLGDNAPLESR